MSYSRPASYPYPPKFKDVNDAEDYAKRMYEALLANDSRGEELGYRTTNKDLKELIIRPEWYGTNVGTGSNDATAIQRAVTAASVHGGTVWFAPNKTYLVGTTVNISSRYPVNLVGGMGFSGADYTYATIKPSAALADGIFKFTKYTGETDYEVPGHKIYGLSFLDDRTHAIFAALNCVDFLFSKIENCWFYNLLGSAIATDNAQMNQIKNCIIMSCGNTSRPGINMGYTNTSAARSNNTVIDSCIIESNYLAPYIYLDYTGTIKISNCGFEASTTELPDTNQTFIYSTANSSRTQIENCHINRNYAIPIDLTGRASQLVNISIADGYDDVERIKISGLECTMTNIYFKGTGNTGADINLTAASGGRHTLSNISMVDSGSVLVACPYTTIVGLASNGSYIDSGSVLTSTAEYNTFSACSISATTQSGIQTYNFNSVTGCTFYDVDVAAIDNSAGANCSYSGNTFGASVAADFSTTHSLLDEVAGNASWNASTETLWETIGLRARALTINHSDTGTAGIALRGKDGANTGNAILGYKGALAWAVGDGGGVFGSNDNDDFVVYTTGSNVFSLWIGGTYVGKFDANSLNLGSGKVVKVNDVQVVGARVIDARASATPNSGDATTDGLIDALRDAMIAHGLIAAS